MTNTFRSILCLTVAGLLAVPTAPLAAQVRSRTLPSSGAPKPGAAPVDTARRPTHGVIDGLVTDTALAPMRDAEIGILRTPVKIATGAQGRFRITDVQMGTYILTVRRFGYRPTATVISPNGGDTLRLSYVLTPLGAGRLDTVRVTERQMSRNLMEFERRRQLGVGKFLSSAELEKRGSVDVSTVLRGFSTLAVVRDDATGVTSLQSRRDQGNQLTATGAGACPVQVVVDNIMMPSQFDVELLPRPKEIAGIEVYGGPSGVPSQFAGADRRCGMVIIWTKDGSR
jgi:hypothetical protein